MSSGLKEKKTFLLLMKNECLGRWNLLFLLKDHQEGKNGSGKLTVAKRNVSFIETNMTGLGLQERENPISAACK